MPEKIDERDKLSDHEREHVETLGKEIIRVCLGEMIGHPNCVTPSMVTTALVSAALHFWRIAPGENTMRRGLENIRASTEDFLRQGEAGKWSELDQAGKDHQRGIMIEDFMRALTERHGPEAVVDMARNIARAYGMGQTRQ